MKTLKGLCAAFVVALLSFIAIPVSAQNYNGNWYNPQQNGMGVDINHQNRTIFAQWFIYDAQGRATFLSFGGPLTKDAQQRDSYSGELTLTTGATPPRHDALLLRFGSVGTVTITFTGKYSAVMTYRYTDSADSTVQSGTLTLAPLQFGCTLPAMWDGTFCVVPMATKVVGANQLPAGCNTWKDQCWRDAIANGTVKLVETSAKMTGYSERPVMVAYFRNTTTMFGVTGLWNSLEVYADDGSPVGADIFGGSSVEIDWVYGTAKGHIVHEKLTGLCYQIAWDAAQRSWDVNGTGVGTPVSCP